jgi:hypothetical protein
MQCIDQVWNSMNVILGKYRSQHCFFLASERIDLAKYVCVTEHFFILNDVLVCNTPFTLVSPTSFYPYCYQINQQSSLVSQLNAIQDCTDKSAQLVWFQSVDELQQQLVPALFARGLARGKLLRISCFIKNFSSRLLDQWNL